MNIVELPPKREAEPPRAEELPTYDARDLVSGGVQAQLLLDGQCYLLRITRAGKLILTK
ncbi:MAG: hemin uptake protein HemP [Pseudomonadota bacterium]